MRQSCGTKAERTVAMTMNKKQVFVLEIMNNQKSTWQGQLRWIDGRKEKSFRSVLELLHLIDSVINEEEDKTPDPAVMWGTRAVGDQNDLF